MTKKTTVLTGVDSNQDQVFLFGPVDEYDEVPVGYYVTAFFEKDTGFCIGCRISDLFAFVDEVIQSIPRFGVVIHDGKVDLRHIFLARAWLDRDKDVSSKYAKIYQWFEVGDRYLVEV